MSPPMETVSRPDSAVTLSAAGGPALAWPAELLTAVAAAAGDKGAALALVKTVNRLAPRPGAGSTLALWEILASLGAIDLTIARVVEPHLDAQAILSQAPDPVDLFAVGVSDSSRWGVFAAHAPGMRLTAAYGDGGWLLDGTKPWCSLAADLTHAIVTAHTSETSRRAFAVRLGDRGVEVISQRWAARGLSAVASPPVRFTAVPAVPVGADDWYLRRPGFAWGGIGVAACWYGGAVGLARSLVTAARRRQPDQVALMHLGGADAVLWAARSALAEAAALVDAGLADGDDGAALMRRVRAVVASAAENVLTRAAHALGPGPLCHDDRHAARVADLQVYLRQHHAERDDAVLGAAVLSAQRAPW